MNDIYTLSIDRYDRETGKFSDETRYFNDFPLAKKTALRLLKKGGDINCYIYSYVESGESQLVYSCRIGFGGGIEENDRRKEINQKPRELTREEVESMRRKELSLADWSILTTYIWMSTKYRNGEADAWARLASEVEEDGTPSFKNAASNAQFWREMNEALLRLAE